MLFNLQYLRLLAALMVVMNHSMSLVMRVGRDDIGQSFEIGAAGVDIFFAISGFIMVYITAGRSVSPAAFFHDRLLRIAPPYWFVTLLMVVLIALIPHIFNNPPVTIPHLLASLLFVPWSEASFAESVPLYLPGWTLNYEMMFYLVFGAALLLAERVRLIAVAATLITLVAMGLLLSPTNMILEFYTHPIIIEFLFGMLIGWMVHSGHVPGKALSAMLLIGGAILLVLLDNLVPVWRFSPERFLVWGVPSALIVAGGVFLEKNGHARRIEPLLLLGNASYAIYLTHYLVVGAVGKIWGSAHLGSRLSDAFLFAACLLPSVGVGLAFHLGFEKPVLGWVKGRMATPPIPGLKTSEAP